MILSLLEAYGMHEAILGSVTCYTNIVRTPLHQVYEQRIDLLLLLTGCNRIPCIRCTVFIRIARLQYLEYAWFIAQFHSLINHRVKCPSSVSCYIFDAMGELTRSLRTSNTENDNLDSSLSNSDTRQPIGYP